MKTFIALVGLVAFSTAEPPPSHSYLPPSPNGRNTNSFGNGGYSSGPAGLPQVVSARNLGQQGAFGSHDSFGHGAAGHGDKGAQGGAHGGNRGSGGFGGQHGGDHGFARNGGGAGGAQGYSQGGAQGYSQGGAQGYSQGGSQAKFEDQTHGGYDQNAAAFARNALEELNQEPASYNFEYMVNDFEQGTDFGHHEEREDESAHGEYHVVLPDGRKQTVSYEADERGFKPRISYEETDASARNGGYDANANNLEHGNQGSHGNGNHGDHGNGFNGARSGSSY